MLWRDKNELDTSKVKRGGQVKNANDEILSINTQYHVAEQKNFSTTRLSET